MSARTSGKIGLLQGMSEMDISRIVLDVEAYSVGLSVTMQVALSILGPVPPGNSPLNGFAILAIALIGLLSIRVQVQKMNLSKQWPKLALEVVVLLFLLFVGIATVAKSRAQ
jgi:hypothetical protein